MLTLNTILSENRMKSSDESYVQHAVSCSPFVAKLFTKDEVLLNDLLVNLGQEYQLVEMQNFLEQQKIDDESTLKRALRHLRQRVMARIIVRDSNGLADLHEVMRTTSCLAQCVICKALDYLHAGLAADVGQPMDEKGRPQSLIVIGMGKLGGGELNVSSDIDLIFAYENIGKTQGEKSISNQEFFTRLAKKLIAAIDEITEDGFVFRVDMRLRPFGSEGALVSNLDALEDYYQHHGREWERYAWIKGLEVTGGHVVSSLLKPFVFRKYLDFGALESMRDLKMQIQREVNRKGMQDNIKLGRGGIREIEFIAQVFQLIRGGQDVSLQIKPTLSVLALLKNKGLLPEKTVGELSASYVFLRNLEHRLMYVEDAQTQDLPKSDEARARIAKAMRFVSWDALLAQLNYHRQQVQQHFDSTFGDKAPSQDDLEKEHAIWQGVISEEEALVALGALGFTDAVEMMRRINTLRQGSRYCQLPEMSRQRFDALMPIAIFQAASMPNADVSLMRVMDFIESICRRASYLALLAEHRQAMHLLVSLCASSPWLTQYLTQHPILLDELLDTRTLYAAPDFNALRAELYARLRDVEGDIELQMNVFRHFKHAHILRFAAQDVSGDLSPEKLSDYLSALADLIVSVSLEVIWLHVKGRHLERPKFAVIGYGKLGGKELGYASDLDIVFLYDDDSLQASEVYARFAQRINNWFNSITSAGLLYETDIELRPDGNSGLLVSSVSAFKEYQMQKAWVWEHQAITRARFIAGDARIAHSFDAIRIEVIKAQRDLAKLKKEVQSMRDKMRAAQPIKANAFDIKHSMGGIIDVEFLVQYLVLANAQKHPQLTENMGNIGLLSLLSSLNIIPEALANAAILAYRDYRHIQHRLKLQGAAHLSVDSHSVGAHPLAVQALWQKVFVDEVHI